MMSDQIRIKITHGLVALALVTAVVGALAHVALTTAKESVTTPSARKQTPQITLPRVSDNYDYLPQPTITAPPINRGALDEIKQQVSGASRTDEMKTGKWIYNRNTGEYVWCNDCGVPSLLPNQLPSSPRPQPQPTPQPTPAPPLPASPQPMVPSVSPTQLPAPKAYELAIFVDGTPRSQELLRWFDTDQSLRNVKAAANYQTYTKDSPLYRTRYASIVPPDSFPAVILQHADGGHIHAAGGNMLPATASQLMDDFRKGHDYSKQVRESDRQMTGLIGQYRYSWDRMITPSMQLSPSILAQAASDQEECVDGNCDRRPGGNIFDRVDRAHNQAIAWVSGGEIVVVIMALAVVALIGVIVWKRL